MTDWKLVADKLAYITYRLLDGDEVDGVYRYLWQQGYVDEDGEWIYDEEITNGLV